MDKFILRIRDVDTVLAQVYNPRDAKLPDGVKGRMSSKGSQAMIQRPDGVVLYALPGDYMVKINNQPLIVLDAPSFGAIFTHPKAGKGK